jgi:hypothetical protein
MLSLILGPVLCRLPDFGAGKEFWPITIGSAGKS